MRRYIEIKQADLSPAQAARKTREFRCPPQQQMQALLAFRKEDIEEAILDVTKIECPCNDYIRSLLYGFHTDLLKHCGHPGSSEGLEESSEEEEPKSKSWTEKLMALIKRKNDSMDEKPQSTVIGQYQHYMHVTHLHQTYNSHRGTPYTC